MKINKREEICGGKYLLRHTEHIYHIKTIIEEENPNYFPISISAMETVVPGSDEYLVLLERNDKKRTKIEKEVEKIIKES